jgi:acyl-CoA thioesterase
MEAAEIIKAMMEKDRFSQWLAIKVERIGPSSVTLSMLVREDMVNGFGIAHGGITYSFADSALAFASNSGGIKSVSINTSITHIAQVNAGDRLTCEARCISESNKIGNYEVKISRSNDPTELVAAFTGTVYRTGKSW